jgi:predicted nucleic acid-binding protein
MSVDLPYVDTSALAKWYISEPGSDDFETFIRRFSQVVISRLSVVELRCLLARRYRAGDITRRVADGAFALFEDDVRHGHLEVRPLSDQHALVALDLLRILSAHPLRTLDALHLATARATGSRILATADRILARSAADLGFEVAIFG